jgi:hypothetical protein
VESALGSRFLGGLVFGQENRKSRRFREPSGTEVRYRAAMLVLLGSQHLLAGGILGELFRLRQGRPTGDGR